MPNAFQFLGDVQRLKPLDDGVLAECAEGTTEIRFVHENIVRVRINPVGLDATDEPYALDPAFRPDVPDVSVIEDTHSAAVDAGTLRVLLQLRPLRLSFETPEGHRFACDDTGPGWYGERFHIWKTAGRGERYFGLGEKTYPLDRTGYTFTNWNTDAPAYSAKTDPLYKTVPFFLALGQDDAGYQVAYGIFLHNARRSHFDFGGQARDRYSFGADGGPITYYLIAGPEPADVIRRYTMLTGRMPLPPRWSLGYQQSRWSYESATEVRRLVDTFRERRIPLDVVYLDIHHMRDYRVLTWHPDRFPDPAALMQDLREQGVRTAIIVDPGVKVDSDYLLYREGLAGDHFVSYPDDSIYEGKVWPGACHFPDFTASDTRRWFGDHCARKLEEGVAGIWVDMNEPSNHRYRSLPDHVVHEMEGRGGTHLEAHNVYGMQMARAAFEAAERKHQDRRPFVLTRAAFSGVQRFAAAWTGDNISSWEHLRMTVPMLLGLGISGVPMVGSDVGGFFGNASAELFVRWMQLGAFSPLFRNHCIHSAARQEPWAFGEEAEAAARRQRSVAGGW